MDPPLKDSLSIWELIRLNLIVCGLELTASAAIVYLPPMLLEAGFEEKYMSWILGLGPFLCLFFVPIIGQWMDTCRSRYGRRIPFMFAFGVIVLASLLFVPYADHMVPTDDKARKAAGKFSLHAWLLALSVILIDFGTQAGLTPCEVFLQDCTKGLPIRDRAFSLYSLMCSLGSCLGYLILAINWENSFLGILFGDQEYCVFYLLFAIFLIMMVINLKTASTVRRRRAALAGNQSSTDLAALDGNSNSVTVQKISTFKFLTQGFVNLYTMPYALRRLVYSNFFAWAATMCFLLFYADYIGEIVYQGNPEAAIQSAERHLFDEGVRMGSFGLFLHSVMSSICAPIIENLEQRVGMKVIHLSSMAILTLSIGLMLLTNNLILLNILAMMTGIGFASLTTIPFSVIGMYHEEKEVYFWDTADPHTRGLGVDMATLDTAYFCSQVLLLSFMGYIVDITDTAIMYIIIAAGLSLISLYFVSTTIFCEQDLPHNKRKQNGVTSDFISALTNQFHNQTVVY